jgi:2,3-bisphosphoglycerate-independent phosphoglycerate mutase
MIKSSNINVALHAISDGRDTKSKVFLDDLKVLLPILENTNVKLASIGGRFYGLDRDKNFDRVIKQYNAMTHDSISFSNPLDYVEESYKNGISDEFIIPAFNNSYSDEETAFKNNDSVIFFNFRPDRARELSHLIQKSDLYDYQND